MMISLIWAMGDNRVIGSENRLPWKLPADMQWFRKQTLGKPVIMGRKTFESFGAKPLPERLNIVVTKNRSYIAEGAVVVHSIDEAFAVVDSAEEVMIIGGAAFYEQALPLADRLYMTLIHHEFDGDTRFPIFDSDQWHEVLREDHESDHKNPYSYSFVILEKHKA